MYRKGAAKVLQSVVFDGDGENDKLRGRQVSGNSLTRESIGSQIKLPSPERWFNKQDPIFEVSRVLVNKVGECARR